MNKLTDIERVRSDLHLSEHRMRHTEGVIEMALLLASRHFPDLPPARVELCALLHDYTKEYSVSEHIEILTRYGKTASDEELRTPELLHARTASEIARHVYGLDKELCEAVLHHTTGAPAMSPLAAVICLADYIEQGRKHPCCIETRNFYETQYAASQSTRALYLALLRSMEQTISHLLQSGREICITTVQARNYYLNLSKDKI